MPEEIMLRHGPGRHPRRRTPAKESSSPADAGGRAPVRPGRADHRPSGRYLAAAKSLPSVLPNPSKERLARKLEVDILQRTRKHSMNLFRTP